MVGPQNRKPSDFSAFDISLLMSVAAGKSAHAGHIVLVGPEIVELPQETVEALAFFDRQIGLRVADGRFDLAAVAHDPGVAQQSLDISLAIARDLRGLEPVEGRAEPLAFAQDGDPGQPGLETVQDQLLPQRAAVDIRPAPFVVVIGNVKRVFPAPATAAVLG